MSIAAAAVCGAAFGAARERLALAKWETQPVASGEVADRTKAPEPKEELWWPQGNPNGGWFDMREGRRRKDGKWVSVKPPFSEETTGKALSAWLRTSFFVPAEAKGRSIVLPCENKTFDVLVRVNGKVAGEVLRPGGELQLADFVGFGATNRLELFVTRENIAVSERHTAYWGYQQNPYDEKTKYAGRGFPKVRVEVRPATYLSDVYLKPSWAKRRVEVEAETVSKSARAAVLKLEFVDADGQVRKTAKLKLDAKAGTSVTTAGFDWPDVEPWEVSRPVVYSVRATLDDGADALPEFLWGFREVRREGKEIVMNGHIQRFRGNYNLYLPLVNDEESCLGGITLLKRLGFNLLYHTHVFDAVPDHSRAFLDTAARQGLAVFTGIANINDMGFGFSADAEAQRQYARHARYALRKYRNSPAIVAFNVGVNTYCPARNMRPELLGQSHDATLSAKRIDTACAICRAEHPNALYYSHADGSTGDISSNNLYLNFTPLQEREEWLAQWSTNGVLPWCAAEWGQPYRGSYWHMSINFLFTEWMAVYFGDEAFRTEPANCAEHILAMGRVNTGWHGASIPEMSLWDYPLFTRFLDLFNWRTMRSFRAYGLNGGLMNFNIGEAFGNPRTPNPPPPIMDYRNIDVTDGRPLWANPSYDVFQRGNHDFCAFVGGADGDHADRTHAYRLGEKIRKDVVLVWDGFGGKSVTVEWRARFSRWGETPVAAGRFTRTLKTGEIARVPLEFVVDEMPKGADGRPLAGEIRMQAYDPDSHELVAADACPFDVHTPGTRKFSRANAPVFVWSPSGGEEDSLSAGRLLRDLGFTAWKPVHSVTSLPRKAVLVIGRNRLGSGVWNALDAARIEAGLRVLVLPQSAEAWQSIGFMCEDSMARKMWPTRAFGGGASPLSFDHWRGSPQGCGADFGHVATAKGTRGPRGTHRHAIAALPLRLPETLGFEPLVWGEFDMNYTGLVRYRLGEGALYFCTLDFEGRAKDDPAARDVAVAMLETVCGNRSPAPCTRPLYFAGRTAERLVADLKADGAALPAADGEVAEGAVVLASAGSGLGWERVKALRKDRKCRVLVVNDDALAEAAGLALGPKAAFAQSYPKEELGREIGSCGVLSGITHKHLRWREPMETRRFAVPEKPDPQAPWRLLFSGLVAVPKSAQDLVFLQVDPYLLSDRYTALMEKEPKEWRHPMARNTVSLSEEHTREMISGILLRFGSKPGARLTKRLLTFDPSRPGFRNPGAWHILGPFAREGLKDAEALAWAPSAQAEEMAADATFNPNPTFRLPQGGAEVNWRPSIIPRADGKVDTIEFRFTTSGENRFGAADSVATEDGAGLPEVNYYITEFEVADGHAEGVIRGKSAGAVRIWLNGAEVFRRDGVAGGRPEFEVRVKFRPGTNRIGLKHYCAQPTRHNSFVLQVSDDPAVAKAVDAGAEKVELLPPDDLYNPLYRKFDPYMYVYW